MNETPDKCPGCGAVIVEVPPEYIDEVTRDFYGCDSQFRKDGVLVRSLNCYMDENKALRRERDKLREALQALMDAQNGPPLLRDAAAWGSAMAGARIALARQEAST